MRISTKQLDDDQEDLKITDDDDWKSIQEHVGDLKLEDYVTTEDKVLTTEFCEMGNSIADNQTTNDISDINYDEEDINT